MQRYCNVSRKNQQLCISMRCLWPRNQDLADPGPSGRLPPRVENVVIDGIKGRREVKEAKTQYFCDPIACIGDHECKEELFRWNGVWHADWWGFIRLLKVRWSIKWDDRCSGCYTLTTHSLLLYPFVVTQNIACSFAIDESLVAIHVVLKNCAGSGRKYGFWRKWLAICLCKQSFFVVKLCNSC